MNKWGDNWHCDWTTVVPMRDDITGVSQWHGEMRTLHRWAGCMNKKLVELTAILPKCHMIEEFSLEASSESELVEGPRWDYLHDSTFCGLISSFPPFLNNLTLDLSGSKAISPDRGRDPVHLCPLIGDRLRDLQIIRLRMRCICPQVFQTSSIESSVTSRLKSLVIKLSLPFFPDIKGKNLGFDAQACDVTPIPLYQRMISSGADFVKILPALSMLRISYREQGHSTICLRLVDCVRARLMSEGSEVFCFEDEGLQWDDWENSETLQDGISLREVLS